MYKQKRKRKRTSAEQLAVLEGVFRANQHPNLTLRNQLAVQLLMTPRSVQKWFQNRRAKARNQVCTNTSKVIGSPLGSNLPQQPDVSRLSDPNINPLGAQLPGQVNPIVAAAAMAAMNVLSQQQQQQPNNGAGLLPSPSVLTGNPPFPILPGLEGGLSSSQVLGLQAQANVLSLYEFFNLSRLSAAMAGNATSTTSAVPNLQVPGLPVPGLPFFASGSGGQSLETNVLEPAIPSPFTSATLAKQSPHIQSRNTLPAIANQSVIAPVAVKAITPPSSPPSQQKPMNGLMLLSGVAGGLINSEQTSGSSTQSTTIPTSSEVSSPLTAFKSSRSPTRSPSHVVDALFSACTNANEAQLLDLIERKVDLNCRDSAGNTPLLLAAGFGYTALVKLLAQNNADVSAENNSGITPVYIAAKFGHQATLEFLLECKGEFNKPEKNTLETALHAATSKGFIQIMTSLLEAGAKVNVKDSLGRTPLHLHSGYPRVVQVLTGKGADVHEKDNEGLTPLHYAVRDGQTSAAVALLDCGAKFDERSSGIGFTPVHMACACLSSPELLELLVERGADPKAKTNDGRTCLHLAVEKGNAEVVTVLMDKGLCDLLDEKDDSGLSPLEIAQKRGEANIVNILQSKATSSK